MKNISYKNYLRSTRNLYYRDEDGLRIFYSYTTPVAFENNKNGFSKRFISENVWSVTTAKHLNWFEDFWGAERKSFRSKHEDFQKELDQARGEGDEPKNDMIKTTAMVSKMFGLLSGGADPQRELEQKKRFFEIAGCTFPEDWDSLSIEEKTKRINKVEQFGMGE